MNAIKRYAKSKGIKFSCDYPWLPYETKNNISIEDCLLNKSTLQIVQYTTVGDLIMTLNRDGTITYDFN